MGQTLESMENSGNPWTSSPECSLPEDSIAFVLPTLSEASFVGTHLITPTLNGGNGGSFTGCRIHGANFESGGQSGMSPPETPIKAPKSGPSTMKTL